MEQLKGKTALVTGGSKGIGFGIAESLIKEGMNVAVTSRSKEAIDQAAAQLNQIGPGKAIGIAADVRKLEAQQTCVERILQEWGSLDVLIANAGLGHFAPIEDLTPRETEVIQLIAEGMTNKAIAQQLDISAHTVKFHVNAIMNKLAAQSRTEAVVRATRMGLISL